jgi:hypothetical protein
MVRSLRAGGWSLALAFVGGTCALAAHASAAPAPTLFKLTVSGTAQQQWTYSAAPVPEGACARTETSEGIRSATFRTTRAIMVRISHGKVLPATVRGIRGTITLGGANTTDTRCGDAGTTRTADCAQTRRTFTGATLKVASPKARTIAVQPVANARISRADCPVEPAGVIRRPIGPTPTVLQMPPAVLNEHKVSRITLRASPTRQTTFGSPEQGRLEETSEWQFTFVRVRG